MKTESVVEILAQMVAQFAPIALTIRQSSRRHRIFGTFPTKLRLLRHVTPGAASHHALFIVNA